MKVSELREMTQEQLREELENTRQELFNLRFRLVIRQLEDTNALRRAKRKIARIKTILREWELYEKYVQQSEEEA